MASPTELRLKIVQHRMRFLNRAGGSPEEERRALAELEKLHTQLAALEKGSSASDEAERRWARRIQVQLPCRYLPTDSSDRPPTSAWSASHAAEVVDVSRGGLLLATPERLAPGARLWVEVTPRPGARPVKPVAMRTSVVRSVLDGRRHLVGLEWVDAAPRDVEALEAALALSLTRSEGAVHEGEVRATDRRRHVRHEIVIPLRFIITRLPAVDWKLARGKGLAIGTKSGDSQDFSKGGMLFSTSVSVLPGSTLTVEVPRPDRETPLVRVRGDAVRVTMRGGRHWIGLRFVDPPELDPRLIEQVMRAAGE